jgi:hypothetical protein
VGRRKPLSADTLRASRAVPAAPATPAPIPTAPAPEAAKPAFAIVQTQVVLYAEKLSNAKVYGTVAKLSNGRLRFRYLISGRDGSALSAYGDWSEEHDATKPLPRPVDWGGWARSKVDSPSVIRNLLPPPDELEIDRFRAAWPVLAAKLGVESPAQPMRRFSPGPTWYPATTMGVSLSTSWWRNWLDKHCAGDDWGLFGSWPAISALTQDQLWTMDEQTIECQNVAAVTTNSGAVRSRFVLDDATQNLLAHPTYGLMGRCKVVDLTTAFSRRGPITICSIEEINACETG